MRRFNLDQSVEVQSYPKIFSKLKWGTRELRWDVRLSLEPKTAYRVLT